MIAAGANVICTTKGMDDIAAKYLVSKGIMGLRRLDGKELRLLAKATGATVVTTLANSEGGETFSED